MRVRNIMHFIHIQIKTNTNKKDFEREYGKRKKMFEKFNNKIINPQYTPGNLYKVIGIGKTPPRARDNQINFTIDQSDHPPSPKYDENYLFPYN